MYYVHTTAGFIIDTRPYGEAGKIISLFTREFGLVQAMAQGIRLEKSKLRYHTQDFSLGIFSLVRGKEFWKLTSAQERKVHGARAHVRSAQELSAKIALILRRFLHGEDAHPVLFDIIESACEYIDTNREMPDERLNTLESVVMLRILDSLGYIGKDPALGAKIKSEPLSAALVDELTSVRPLINGHINKALRESHL